MKIVTINFKICLVDFLTNKFIKLKKFQMKTIKVKSVTFLLFVFISTFVCYSQSSNINANSKQFEYLIGKEYTNVSELGDFKYKLRETSTFESKGIKYGITHIIINNQSIIILEFLHTKDSTIVHRIADLVVYKDVVSTCTQCLFPKYTAEMILSIHPDIFNKSRTDTVLAAFEINYETGKFNRVDRAKYIQVKKLETVKY